LHQFFEKKKNTQILRENFHFRYERCEWCEHVNLI